MSVALKNTINVHRQKGEWEEIVPLAQEILEQDPGDLSALRSLAEAHEHMEQTDEAIEAWKLLVDRHHEVTPYARKLGIALKQIKDPDARHYLAQSIAVAIDRKHMADVEELWLELVELNDPTPTLFFEYAQRLAGRKEKERAGELLIILTESGTLQPVDQLRCLRLIVEYLPDRQSDFRTPLITAFKAVYADRPDLAKLMDLSGLATADNVQGAITELDRYLIFGEGQFFYHNGWGAGKVQRIDPSLQRVSIDFAKKKGHILTLEMADKSLLPIPHADIRALMLEDEEAVKKLVVSNPSEVVKSALIALGGKATGKEIKDILLNKPITEPDWNKWWTTVNKKLKDDHFVEVSGGALKTYTLRQVAETPDQEYARRFRDARTLRARLDIFADYRNHLGDVCDRDTLNQMAVDLISKASATRAEGEAIETVFVVEAIEDRITVNKIHLEKIKEPILNNLDRAVSALEGLKAVALQARWFGMMEENLRDQLAEAYERLLFDGPDPIRDLVAEHVKKSHEEDVLALLFRSLRPIHRDHPALFIWFARKIVASRKAAEQMGVSRPAVIEQIISLHEVLGYRVKTGKKDGSAELRACMADIRQLLKKSGFKLLREILPETDAPTARLLYRTTEGAAGIEDRIRKEIMGYLNAHFQDALTSGPEGAARESQFIPLPDRLLCLEESLASKRTQLKHLQEVEIPTNTAEIEAARALGDLRENAEYHAAKDKQRLLMSLSGKLQEEVSRALVIREEENGGEIVQFGSRVIVRLGGKEREVIVLGPWESNPDANILSYESPLGKALWGRKAGDAFQFLSMGSEVPLEILSVEAVLKPENLLVAS